MTDFGVEIVVKIDLSSEQTMCFTESLSDILSTRGSQSLLNVL